MHCTPLARALPTGADLEAQTAAATVINETMEQVILRDPGQYLWGYNRYKQPRPQDVPATDAETA
jgi:KDO2-lipid IV(A) lauroyltransferase